MKQEIINRYFDKVHGKCPDLSDTNIHHDGKEGHWLEHQFDIKSNANNAPDLFGYELKNETTSKTTFGDWSPNEWIYKSKKYPTVFNKKKTIENRDIFLRIFGQKNLNKKGRYSWSGEPCPKIGAFNSYGQILRIEDNNDITVIYDYQKDTRLDKETIVPSVFRTQPIVLAKWFGHPLASRKSARDKSLQEKLEDKFNSKGWFTCKKNKDGVYCQICFGKPINFPTWLSLVRKGIVFFDCGMYEGNGRPYAQWRANNSYWNSLITERYPR